MKLSHFFFSFLLTSTAFSVEYVPITVPEVKKEIQNGCAVVHVWASWCTYCVEEMPAFLKYFEEQKTAKTLVIDISAFLAQNEFSAPWLKKMPSSFRTYRIMELDPNQFMKDINANWHKSLPYTAFYFHGKLQKEWGGKLSTSELGDFIKKACPSQPSLKGLRGK